MKDNTETFHVVQLTQESRIIRSTLRRKKGLCTMARTEIGVSGLPVGAKQDWGSANLSPFRLYFGIFMYQ